MSEMVEKAVAVRASAGSDVVLGDGGRVQFRSLAAMMEFGAVVARSGFAPKGMEKPEAIAIAVQHGAELGLMPMQALQSIAVVNGRPAIYGDAALALVRGCGLCESYEQSLVGEGDKRRAVVTSLRKGAKKPLVTEFGVDDAKRAGLWGKAGPWTQYPDRMLVFRARGFNLRDNFGDVLKGLQTAEELRDQRTSERDVSQEATSRVITADDVMRGSVPPVGEVPSEVENAPTEPYPVNQPTTDDAERDGRTARLLEWAQSCGADADALVAWLRAVKYVAEDGGVSDVDSAKADGILGKFRARATASLQSYVAKVKAEAEPETDAEKEVF